MSTPTSNDRTPFDWCELSPFLRDLLEPIEPDPSEHPIYRGEEDLESIRNSDSPFVAVIVPDQDMTLYVSREKVLNGEINPATMSAEELFEHAGVI